MKAPNERIAGGEAVDAWHQVIDFHSTQKP
jgi:hypothetical protein